MTASGHPPTETGQPRIPGIRYRTEKRTRTVTTTVRGDSRPTPDTYYVQVPVPPRDWDYALLCAVTVAAVAVSAVSVAWTTASIGALLTLKVHPVIAYGAAGVFDMGWLVCQALEWLARYDPKRAKLAQRAGWVALVLAMAAVATEGVAEGSRATGAVGAGVSLVAKGLWIVVLRHYAVPLSEGHASWLLQRRQEITAERALAGELRRLDAADAYTKLAFSSPTGELAADSSPDSVLDAPDSRPAPIPPPADAPAPRDTDSSADTSGAAAGHPAAPVAPIGESIAATTRTVRAQLLAEHGDLPRGELLALALPRVRVVHGDSPQLADTVRRSLGRAEKATKRDAS